MAESEKITIERIKRAGQLYSVSFSDGACVKATRGALDRLNLSEGLSFSLAEYRLLCEELAVSHAVFLAESILARRAHSIGEFRQKMTRKEIPGRLIAQIIEDFKTRGFLDDRRFAMLRVRSLLSRKPAGRALLVSDLRKKFVPRDVADEVVTELLAGEDQSVLAQRLLEKRRLYFLKFDVETARQKAYTYLSRRAIPYGAAKEAFEKFKKDNF
jgi:regulatory protein